ncbi:MAG: SUMF1/EgtB/PvdO family nonheme iron enzyme [Treponema sp.]|nr:SUMF1/EgtB/PvdO family nonheme iron enzyme [Treponema sp.]
MKNTRTLLGVVAVIGFVAVSCGNNTTPNGTVPGGTVPSGPTMRTVTFNTAGGSDIAPARVPDGQAVARPGQDPTRGSYVFAGWYTAAAGGTAFYFGTPITANTTIHARWAAPAPTMEVEIAAGITMEMNWIPAGNFTMGQNDLPDWSPAPERQVTLTRGFYMGIHAVTQEQFQAVMGYNPSHFSGSPAAGETRPVEMVNWYHAIAFANRLSIMQGLDPVYYVYGVNWETLTFTDVPVDWNDPRCTYWDAVTANWNANGFRLATEAEWEYAARAGTTTQWSFGDTDDDSDYYAWTSSNSNWMTREVGLLEPNAWGLYDMHGNVWEWVWDWFGELDASAATDPTGAVSGGDRVLRGGGWSFPPGDARSAIRVHGSPDNRSAHFGFRVVRP